MSGESAFAFGPGMDSALSSRAVAPSPDQCLRVVVESVGAVPHAPRRLIMFMHRGACAVRHDDGRLLWLETATNGAFRDSLDQIQVVDNSYWDRELLPKDHGSEALAMRSVDDLSEWLSVDNDPSLVAETSEGVQHWTVPLEAGGAADVVVGTHGVVTHVAYASPDPTRTFTLNVPLVEEIEPAGQWFLARDIPPR